MLGDRAPSYSTRLIDLPLCRLHVLESGSGEPLVMVPATISELENWLPLARFMAQWFRVFFFELPGHGLSQPLPERFSSARVAGVIEQLADALGFERFSLMGFSFGGILAMHAFQRLAPCIDRLILIAPCLSHRALQFSPLRLDLARSLNGLLGRPAIQSRFVDLVHDPRAVGLITRALKAAGRLEDTMALEEKLLRISPGTVGVLNAQIHEILTTSFAAPSARYDTPCYFAMSVYDPVLRFELTERILNDSFTDLQTVRLTYPFHQPPRPFSFDELNRDFGATVDEFLCDRVPVL